jgi:hypothetical protein
MVQYQKEQLASFTAASRSEARRNGPILGRIAWTGIAEIEAVGHPTCALGRQQLLSSACIRALSVTRFTHVSSDSRMA